MAGFSRRYLAPRRDGLLAFDSCYCLAEADDVKVTIRVTALEEGSCGPGDKLERGSPVGYAVPVSFPWKWDTLSLAR